jgi:hypothetical protein
MFNLAAAAVPRPYRPDPVMNNNFRRFLAPEECWLWLYSMMLPMKTIIFFVCLAANLYGFMEKKEVEKTNAGLMRTPNRLKVYHQRIIIEIEL